MTNVRRPIHLQLRPAGVAAFAGLATPAAAPVSSAPLATCHSPKALSPTGDSLPTQILPHLFVGNQEQTNRETVNRLNIKYILSLGLLPIVSSVSSPTSPVGAQQQQTSNNQILMPSQNSSKDFKIRIRSNTPTTPATNDQSSTPSKRNTINHRDENKGVKTVRSIYCKCINIADDSDQLLIKFFDEAHAFIDEARRKKCNILVHCLAGVSRSPTFAIAYLMRVKSLHWKVAYDLVKQSRPQIDPNLSFMGQLRIYNRSLREEMAITNGHDDPDNKLS